MEQWYSIIEYARKFNISDMTVRRRIKTGKIRAVLKEGKYYIPINDSNSSSKIMEPSLEKVASPSYIDTTRNYSNNNSNTNNNNDNAQVETSNFRKDTSLSRALSGYATTTKTPSLNNEYGKPDTSSIGSNNSNSTNNSLVRAGLEKNPLGSNQGIKLQGRTLDNNTLLSNYNNMLQQFRRFEKILESSYNSKILHLESELKIQKIENANLKQQLEDLQVLIKLLEKK